MNKNTLYVILFLALIVMSFYGLKDDPIDITDSYISQPLKTLGGTITNNKLSLGKVSCENNLNSHNSDWDNGISCSLTVFYTTSNGGPVLNSSITFSTDDDTGRFIPYNEDTYKDTMSSTTNSVVLKIGLTDVDDGVGGKYSGQSIKYIQKGTVIPTFTITTPDNLTLTNK